MGLLVAGWVSVCCCFSNLGIDYSDRLVWRCFSLDCLSRVSNVLVWGGVDDLFEFGVCWLWFDGGATLLGVRLCCCLRQGLFSGCFGLRLLGTWVLVFYAFCGLL